MEIVSTTELVAFVDALGLHLQIGLELSYAWNRSLPEGKLRTVLELPPHVSLHDHLQKLGPADPWFRLLAGLYASGAPLAQALEAWGRALRGARNSRVEAHLRAMPWRVNAVLILFFLPPLMLILCVPLLLEIIKTF